MIDPPTEPPFNDRWQAEPDTSWGDRPGIVASLLRYWVVVVAATLLGAVAGYGLAQRLPVRYDADATLILSDPGDPSVLGAGSGLSSDDRKAYLAKQAEIMTSTEVLQRAQQLLNSNQSVQDLKDQVSAEPSASLASVSIAASTGDPGSAAALANAVGTAYEQITAERATADANRTVASLEQLRERYQADLDALPKSPDGQLTSRQQQLVGQITNIDQREQDITTQVALYASGVQYFEKAEPPTARSQPRPKLAAALGGLLGLIAAAAWAWWAAARHQRAEDRGEPARILEAPLLGEVPPPRAHPVPVGDSANASELDPDLEDSFQLIVASMEHELAGVSGKSIAVTGLGADDTTTSTTLEIARAASQQERRILLIDADVRTRHLTDRVAKPAATSGHNGATRGHRQRGHRPRQEPEGDLSGAALEYLDRFVPTDIGTVLPLSSTHADGGANGAVDVRHAVRSVGDLFDLVLVDAPALLASSNAIGVAGQADAVVLVVPHRVALSDLRDARDRLAFVKTPLLGYVYVRPRRVARRSKSAAQRSHRS